MGCVADGHGNRFLMCWRSGSAGSVCRDRTTRSAASRRVRHWSQDVRDDTGFYPSDEDQFLDPEQVHTVTACRRCADIVCPL